MAQRTLTHKQKTFFAKKERTKRPPRNWSLILGTLLVLLVTGLAIAGPTIAPRDPLEDNMLVQDSDGEWHIPPFPAFKVEGFPLGSDEFGRDLFSRLLWATAPTLRMVAIVATVRLVMGTLIGLAAGWSTSWVGKMLDNIIGGALSLPTLMVALGAIAAIGPELGLIAFIAGLSLTGWAETARMVREQTRAIKGELYVEAARALGAPNSQIIFLHVLRQVAAMIWMLFAFEISSTLMVTAGLGFLGYYIGGDVWVDVDDFVARRTSGSPELGQMLATAWVRLTDPWGLVSVGSVVFFTLLGFNLIGEGFRLRASPEAFVRRNQWFSKIMQNVSYTLDNYIWHPVSQLFGNKWIYGTTVFVVGILIGSYTMNWWITNPPDGERNPIAMMFGNEADENDATPTAASAAENATVNIQPTPTAEVIMVDASAEDRPPPEPAVTWTFEGAGSFVGAPVVAEDGTVFAAAQPGKLYALSPTGDLLWDAELPDAPGGPPALAADGIIYVTDKSGGLSAFLPSGELHWRFEMEARLGATSGPVVAADGTIYYTQGGTNGFVQAVLPDGAQHWHAALDTFSFHRPPLLSAAGDVLFVADDVLWTADGTPAALEFSVPVDNYLVGADGQNYLRSGQTLLQWALASRTAEVAKTITWNYTEFLSEDFLPQESGISQGGLVWLLYTTEFGGDTSVFWVETQGEDVWQLSGTTSAPLSDGRLVYLDEAARQAVLCGLGDYAFQQQNAPKPACYAVQLGVDEPLWSIEIEPTDIFVGGIYDLAHSGLLYVTTEGGALHAVNPAPAPDTGAPTSFSLPTEEIPLTDPVIAWEFEDESGFAGTPALGADHTIYAAAKGGSVYALTLEGAVLWQKEIDPPPKFSPVLGPDGNLYVPDKNGGMTALSPAGEILWQFAQTEFTNLKPSAQATIASDGNIYLTLTNGGNGFMQALSPTGEHRWLTKADTFSFTNSPVLSVEEDLVFLAGDAFDAATGEKLTTAFEFKPDEFIAGKNGHNYGRSDNTMFEWKRNGSQIELIETIEWPEPPPNFWGNQGTPTYIRVGADNVITLLYGGLIQRINTAGELLHTENGNTGGQAIAIHDDHTIFTCGMAGNGSIFTEVCSAFAMTSEDALWQIDFGRVNNFSNTIAGGVRTPTGFILASETGMLYGVMEASIAEQWAAAQVAAEEAAQAQEALEGVETATTGSGWAFDTPEDILVPPIVHTDGSVYVLTEAFTFYIINPDGGIRTALPLPTPPHIQEQTGFGGGTTATPIPPVLAPDGSILIVSSDRVYALSLDGIEQWEFPLDKAPYATLVNGGADGAYYLVDQLGSFYALSPAEGLLWKHDLEEGLKAASRPVFGANGEIYYTITNGSVAKIEALTPAGERRWRADLDVFRFYDMLQITPDGSWLSVDDNVVNAATGQVATLPELEFDPGQFAMGQDGKVYSLSGSTIFEWETSASGFEIVRQFSVSFPAASRGVPPFMSVSSDQIHWVWLFSSGGRTVHVWVDAEGTILNIVDFIRRQYVFLEADFEQSRLSFCDPQRDENRLDCFGYTPASIEPAWQVSINGIGAANAIFYTNGTLYVQVDADTVQTVDVELPVGR